MSDDFIDGLRNDLVGAMEGYERGRRRVPLPSRLPRPIALLRPLALAAVVVAIVVGARAFQHEAPPARPHITAVLAIGGQPVDAALADRSLWVSDFAGALVELDPAAQRVTRRIHVRGQPEAVAAEAGSVWTLETGDTHCGGELLRYDARSGGLVDRRSLPYPTDDGVALAAGGNGVWVKTCAGGEGVAHVGPTGTTTAHVRLEAVDGVAAASGSVWAIGHDGTLVEADAASGHVRHRWSRFVPLSDPSFTFATDVVAVDGSGAWVLSTGRAAILRIEHGRVVRKLTVDPAAGPLLAVAPDGLWIAAGDRSGTGNRLIRYDLRTGRPSATLELGTRRPVALIASGDRLCVVTGDGRILFVGA